MLCVPGDNDVIGGDAAVPLLNVTGEPRLATPSLNCTVPVGVPTPRATDATVAVNVVDCPNTKGLAEEVSAVVLRARFTTCGFVFSDPVLPVKFALPPYTALII